MAGRRLRNAVQLVAAFGLLNFAGNLRAEDAYFAVPLEQLKVTSAKLPGNGTDGWGRLPTRPISTRTPFPMRFSTAKGKRSAFSAVVAGRGPQPLCSHGRTAQIFGDVYHP